MKFVTILASFVLVLGLAATASAGLTDNFADNAGTGQGGTWGTAPYSTATRTRQPSGNALDVYSDNQDWYHGILKLDLASGTPATDIAAAGVFYIEFDLDQIQIGANKKDDAFFYLFKNDTAAPSYPMNGWREQYGYRESGSPIRWPAGWYKYEFTITSGTWGTGNVGVSVKMWQDTVMNGNDNWVEKTSSLQMKTATIDTNEAVYVGWQATSAPSGGDLARLKMGDDMPGGIGLNIYVPEPATVAILGLGSLVLLRRRRA